MRIGVQAWGSEGDMRPFIALSRGLAAAGHSVILSISEIEGRDYSDFIKDTDIELRSTPGLDCSQDELTEMGKDAIASWNALAQFQFVVKDLFNAMLEAVLRESKYLVSNCDLVIGHFVLHPLVTVAEKNGIPHIGVATTPTVFPSGYLPAPGLPSFGPLINRLVWKLGSFIVDQYILDDVNTIREREGLPPSDHLMDEAVMSGLLNLVESSPSLFPPPPDWGDTYHVCGRFRMDDGVEENISEDLESFLNAGPPPVWITFGSMMVFESNADEIFGILAEAADEAGCRAVIQCDRDDLRRRNVSSTIFHVKRAPHSLVFPRCAAIVHHGGAATSHSATLSGRPSVVVMFGVDQIFWGPHLNRMGVAPVPLLRRKLTVTKLADRLKQVISDPKYRRSAEALGKRMEQENGVAAALHLIEEAMSRHG